MSIYPADSWIRAPLVQRPKYNAQGAVAELTVSIAVNTILSMEDPLLRTVSIDAMVQSIAKCSLEEFDYHPKHLSSLIKTALMTLLLLKPKTLKDAGGDLPNPPDVVQNLADKISHFIKFMADRNIPSLKKFHFQNNPQQTAQLLNSDPCDLYTLVKLRAKAIQKLFSKTSPPIEE